MQSGRLTTEEFDEIWEALNPQGKPFLGFSDFLDGMVGIKLDDKSGLRDKFNLTKPNQLMSLVMDTPVAAWEHKQIMENFDGLEKLGLAVLNRNDTDMSVERRRKLMERANEGTIHELEPQQAADLKTLHHRNVLQAFIIGFLSCVSCITQVVPPLLHAGIANQVK